MYFYQVPRDPVKSVCALLRVLVILTAFMVGLLLYIAVAKAQEVAQGVICDTEEQMRLFVGLEVNGVNVAVEEINKHFPNACGVVIAVFVKNKVIGQIRAQRLLEIVEITVIGIHDGREFVVVPPQVQFALFLKREQDG